MNKTQTELKHIPGPLTVGYPKDGSGITGPTCPTISGATVAERVAYRNWVEMPDDYRPSSVPRTSKIITVGHSVAAIIPQPENDEYDVETVRRVFAAAYNSYDRHCGPRAAECAEGDLLGELLETLRKLQAAEDFAASEGVAIDDHMPRQERRELIQNAIAKASGTRRS